MTTKPLTPLKSIRKKCLDCCCGSKNEVKYCVCYGCFLFPYRFGHRPKAADVEAMKAAQEIERERDRAKKSRTHA